MYPLILVLLLLVVKGGVQAACNARSYGKYMECLSNKVDGDYFGFEHELNADYRNLVNFCFSPSIDAKKCTLESVEQLTSSYMLGVDGPLAACPLCRQIAQVIKGVLTSPNVSPSSIKCIHTNLTQLYTLPLQQCVGGEMQGVVMPPLLNYDRNGYDHRQEMIETASSFVMSTYHLETCAESRRGGESSGEFDDRLRGTAQCLGRRSVDGKPIWQRHCTTRGQCLKINRACEQKHLAMEKVICGCAKKNRRRVVRLNEVAYKDVVQLIGEIRRSEANNVRDRCLPVGGNSTVTPRYVKCKCQRILGQFVDDYGAHQLNLREFLSRVVHCVDVPESQRRASTVDSLIRLGCRHVAYPKDNNDLNSSANNLLITLRFMTKLVDALVLRMTRFCPGNHCA